MEKYTEQYLRINNLDKNWHQDRLKEFIDMVDNRNAPFITMIICCNEHLEAILPELTRYTFTLGKRVGCIGRELNITVGTI